MLKLLKNKSLTDLLWVAGTTIGSIALSILFDLHEKVMSFLRRYESLELDEVTTAGILVLVASFAWYGWRRLRESNQIREGLENEIAQHERTNNALIETRTHLENLLISSPAVIYTCEPSGDFPAVFISENIETQLGYKPKEFLETPNFWADHIHPDDAPRVFAELSELFEHGKHTHEYRFRHNDGTYRWMRDNLKLIHDAQGEPSMIVGFWIDITERKQAEEQLREREEQVRLLLDSTAEAIYGLDTKGNCTFANSACVSILGYNSLDDLIGKNMHDLIHHTRPDGSHYPVEECRIYKAFMRGVGTHVDDEVLWRADGISFPAEYWSYPIYKDGEVVGSVVTFLDISERKQLEQELKKYHNELEQIVEERTTKLKESDQEKSLILSSMSESLSYISRDLKILWANQAAAELSGIDLEELKGRDCHEVWSQHDVQCEDCPAEESFKTGQPYEIERTSTDGKVWYVRGNPVLDDSNNIMGVIELIQDITERKKAQEEIKKSSKLACHPVLRTRGMLASAGGPLDPTLGQRGTYPL